MRVAVLSRKRGLYSTRRLREEFLTLGCEVRTLDPIKCVIRLADGRPTVLYNRRDMSDVEALVPRVGIYFLPYILSVVRQFGFMRACCLNREEAIACARDKIRTLQTLVKEGIPIPKTLIARFPTHFERMVSQVDGPPVVLKLNSGTQGAGVIFSETLEAARSSLEAVWSLGADIMMQEFVEESRGRDIRALVLGGEVVAAMRRIAGRGEFRSNIHQGGRGEPVELDPRYTRTAVQAARAVGLNLAGVDMLETHDGPLVIEVNASPGFQGLEVATGLNIAGMIADYTVGLARRTRSARA